jgi:competence protein ComEA
MHKGKPAAMAAGNMHRIDFITRKKQVAAALIFVPLFVLSGCSGKKTVYQAGLVTEQAASELSGEGSAADASDGTQMDGREVTDSVSGKDTTAQTAVGTDTAVQTAGTEGSGYLYVCGAVAVPGVYPVYPGMRVYEAIALAGGFSEEADEQWLNQAETVQDGQRLYVYSREETQQMKSEGITADQTSASQAVSGSPNDTNGKININTADRETLMTLPGIGEAKADAMISYRQEHGSFSSIEEIQNISGIKNAVFSKIKDRITV